MSERKDTGRGIGTETAHVKPWNKKQMAVIEAYGLDPDKITAPVVDNLVTYHEDDATETLENITASRLASVPNAKPAYEEGPHLDDPEIRAAKLETLQKQNATEDDDIGDQAKAILREAAKKG